MEGFDWLLLLEECWKTLFRLWLLLLSDVSTRSTVKLGAISTVSIPTKIGACSSSSALSMGFQSIPTVSSMGGMVKVVVSGTIVVVVKNTFFVVVGRVVVVVVDVVVVDVVVVVVVDVVSGVRISGSTSFRLSAMLTKEGKGSSAF